MAIDRSYIGRQGKPVTMHVEWGKIREFARAIKDDDPLYVDAQHARTEAGGVWAPVTFLQTLRFWDDGRGSVRPPFDLKRTLHGEQEYEFFKPVLAGDTLTAVSRIVDLYEKSSPSNRLVFTIREQTYTDQNGKVKAIVRQTTGRTFDPVKE